MTATPLNGPFMTGRQMTDYSDDPGWAIPPAVRPEGMASGTARRMASLLRAGYDQEG